MASRIAALLFRALFAIIMAALAFWVVNIGVQYAIFAFSSMGMTTARQDIDIIPFIASATASRPLGISLDRGPLVVSTCAALVLLFAATLKSTGSPRLQISQEKVYGSQRFSTIEERRAYAHLKDTEKHPKPGWIEEVRDDNIILTKNSMVSASRIPDHGLESQVPNRNLFLMAGSGAGKTYYMLRNNILQLLGSYVFTDPSGELARTYIAFLEAHGYKVYVLDFKDAEHITASTGYNPLMRCRTIADINTLIEVFVSNTKGEGTAGDQQFFINMEKSFYLCACGLMVFWTGRNGGSGECSLPKLIDFLQMVKKMGSDELTRLDYIFEGTYEDMDFPGFAQYIIDSHDGKRSALDDDALPENAVLSAYRTFKANAGAPEQMAAVISSCAARLNRLNDPAIRRLLERDELDLTKIGKERSALFFCIKDGSGPYDFIAAMALSQLFSQSMDVASSGSGHLDIPMWCFLDEVANIGKIPNLEKLFAVSRKYWINLWAIVQDGQQLEAIYGKQAASIKANCAIFEYLGSSRYEDCEQISKELGYTTRMVREISQSKSSSGTSVTTRWAPQKIALMAPEELYNFNDSDGLAPWKCLTHYKQGMWFLDDKPDPDAHPRASELKSLGPTDVLAWARERREGRDADEAA